MSLSNINYTTNDVGGVAKSADSDSAIDQLLEVESTNYEEFKEVIMKLDKCKLENEKLIACNSFLTAQVHSLSQQLLECKNATIERKSIGIQVDQTDLQSAGMENIPVWDDGSTAEVKTITDDIKAVAEAALQQSGFVYEPISNMYYDYNSGYYYDNERSLYYEPHSGTYYYYDESSQQYQVHSCVDLSQYYPDIPNGDHTQNTHQIVDDASKPSQQSKKNKCCKHGQKSVTFNTNNRQKTTVVLLTMHDHKHHMAQFGASILEKSNKDKILSEEQHLSIKSRLRNPNSVDSYECKLWMKGKGFRLLPPSQEGADEVLVIPKKGTRDDGELSHYVTVIHAGDLYRLVQKFHVQPTSHVRHKVVRQRVRNEYHGVPTEYIREFCETCPTCAQAGHVVRPFTKEELHARVESAGEESEKGRVADEREIMETDDVNVDERIEREINATSEEKIGDDRDEGYSIKDDLDYTSNCGGDAMSVMSDSEAELESGEVTSDSDVECTCDADDEDRSTVEDIEINATNYPPCIRVIVKSSEFVDPGSLFIITCQGGGIGHDDPIHSICLPDPGIAQHHAEIWYNEVSQTYLIHPSSDDCSTFVNSQPVSQTTLNYLSHGDVLTIGTTQLLLHIHAGLETCDECEPGVVQAKLKAAAPREITIVSKEDKKKAMRGEKKRLMKKYGLANMHYEQQDPSRTRANYTDRAGERRREVGSDNPHQKSASPATVDQPIPMENKGRKMLERLGWSEGDSLGKTGSGLTEPVNVSLRLNQRQGLGSERNLNTSIDDVGSKSSKSALNRIKTQQRFEELFDGKKAPATEQNEGESRDDAGDVGNRRGIAWVKGETAEFS